MNQLQVVKQKLVNFNGAELMGVKTDDGKVRVGVSWICEGIGLTRDQAKNERRKIQEDLVLQKGGLNLTLPTKGGRQEVLTIELDFLPLWLAKISITPNMQKESPEVTENLIEYQLKAKDVLADAFIANKHPKTQAELIAMLAQHNVEQERRITVVEEKQDNIVSILSLNIRDWRNEVNRIINAIAMKLGGGEYYSEIRNESYELLESRAACNLDIRLQNRRSKMALRGLSHSAIGKVSKLDVIEEDKKLISVYITVIKELAVKYQLNLSKYQLTETAGV